MKRLSGLVLCALALPTAALAASKTYDVGAFERVAVSAGITADIRVGSPASVVAETQASDFDDLKISVEGNVLRIGRPSTGWFSFGRRHRYTVHVVAPTLRALQTSSGAEASVTGPVQGDFSVDASSGSEARVAGLQGGSVKAESSSGADLEIAGSCVSLEADASSGAELDAGDLKCQDVSVGASSGADVSVHASRSVKGGASSGADIDIHGGPPDVKMEKSSGGDYDVGK